MRIDFNKNRCVEFIEFLSGIDGAIQPHIYGVEAFAVDAEILIGILREKNAGMVDDSEMGYCYNFMDISVGVYRESTPESVLEMMKEVGEDLTSEDLEIELKKANHWDSLGIGVRGYYRSAHRFVCSTKHCLPLLRTDKGKYVLIIRRT